MPFLESVLAPATVEAVCLPITSAMMARLNGSACAVCGATAGLRDGRHHVYTTDGDGGLYGWPVRVCPEH